MKKELSSLYVKNSAETEENMELQELYHFINLQPEIVERMESVSKEVDLKETESLLERMMNYETAEEGYTEYTWIVKAGGNED